MPFKKGDKKPAGSGKTKGVHNKVTLEFKEAVNNLINFATPQMVDWLGQIAQESPDKALDHVYKFAQFGYPLLARTEMTGKDGGAVKVMMDTIKMDGHELNFDLGGKNEKTTD